MISHLLDTNACIALINGKPKNVRRRFDQALRSGAVLATSSVAAFELWYGVAKSDRADTNRLRVEVFLAGALQIVPFTDADAAVAGQLRAKLEKGGKPIGAYDTLIAAQALRLNCIVVTANIREFSRANLPIEDWTKRDAQMEI